MYADVRRRASSSVIRRFTVAKTDPRYPQCVSRPLKPQLDTMSTKATPQSRLQFHRPDLYAAE